MPCRRVHFAACIPAASHCPIAVGARPVPQRGRSAGAAAHRVAGRDDGRRLMVVVMEAFGTVLCWGLRKTEVEEKDLVL